MKYRYLIYMLFELSSIHPSVPVLSAHLNRNVQSYYSHPSLHLRRLQGELNHSCHRKLQSGSYIERLQANG